MPEAAMHEYHFTSCRKHQVRLPWQAFVMKYVAKAKRVQDALDRKLWLRVL